MISADTARLFTFETYPLSINSEIFCVIVILSELS